MGKKIAVVTGASSGLGQEFVRQLEGACRGENALFEECPEELWVIARREERLHALAEVTSIPLRVLPMDLTQKDSIDALAELLERENPEVLMLINAAGFGRIGRTMDQTLDELDGMIDLNCRAAVDLTQLVLPYMRKNGRILEICSTAAFQPITRLNVYAATKAFLYHYSRALRVELLPLSIYVTAVCPYWVKDTEFISLAERKNEGEDPGIADYPWLPGKRMWCGMRSRMRHCVCRCLHRDRSARCTALSESCFRLMFSCSRGRRFEDSNRLPPPAGVL